MASAVDPPHEHAEDRPIGWWLKHVDQLIERAIERTLAEEGIGRRHWRVLNALASGVRTLPELDRALVQFPEAAPALSAVVAQLVARGWVRRSTGRLELTRTGAAARERLVRAVRAQRARVTEGIDPEHYRVTVATLRQMADNLSR